VNLGHTAEDRVEFLCTRSFFADFTFRSPKYRKASGQEKEAADVLVVFRNTLLAIQVKTKAVKTPNGQISGVEGARLSRKLEETFRQFRALVEALNSPEFTSFENGRGIRVKFDKQKITNLVLVIVFEPVSKDHPGRPVVIEAPFLQKAELPVHLFTLSQFSLLLTLADTLPDFLFYLDARWALRWEELVPPDADPIDEWAFITFERKKVGAALKNRSFVNPAGSVSRHKLSIERLEKKEKLSYFIDHLIEALYGCIGSEVPVFPRFVLLADPNSLGAYQQVIPHLAKLDRSQRRLIVEFVYNRVRACRRKELSFRCFKFSEKSSEGFVVLASKGERKLRQVALHNIMRGAALKLGAATLLGLAVGHDWPQSECCDLMTMDCSTVRVDENLKVILREGFGKPYRSSEKRGRWFR
jgi:hypothetical protein